MKKVMTLDYFSHDIFSFLKPPSNIVKLFNYRTLVADPSSDEENICEGTLTIVCEEEKLQSIHKPGSYNQKKI